MEAQMKRGFLEACVLAAVSGEESYGSVLGSCRPDKTRQRRIRH